MVTPVVKINYFSVWCSLNRKTVKTSLIVLIIANSCISEKVLLDFIMISVFTIIHFKSLFRWCIMICIFSCVEFVCFLYILISESISSIVSMSFSFLELISIFVISNSKWKSIIDSSINIRSKMDHLPCFLNMLFKFVEVVKILIFSWVYLTL